MGRRCDVRNPKCLWQIPLAHQSKPQPPTTTAFPCDLSISNIPSTRPAASPPDTWTGSNKQEPIIVWDDASHKPKLETDADWIRAGEIVFSADGTPTDQVFITLGDVQGTAWYQNSGIPLTKDGVLPFVHYIIREKGKIELGSFSCAMCHTRVMPNGTVLKGAQGNFPFERAAKNSALAHMPAPCCSLSIGRSMPFPGSTPIHSTAKRI